MPTADALPVDEALLWFYKPNAVKCTSVLFRLFSVTCFYSWSNIWYFQSTPLCSRYLFQRDPHADEGSFPSVSNLYSWQGMFHVFLQMHTHIYICTHKSKVPKRHAHTYTVEPVSFSCCVSRYNIRGVTNRFKLCTFMFTSFSLLSSYSAPLSLAWLSFLCSFMKQGRIKTVCLKEV